MGVRLRCESSSFDTFQNVRMILPSQTHPSILRQKKTPQSPYFCLLGEDNFFDNFPLFFFAPFFNISFLFLS